MSWLSWWQSLNNFQKWWPLAFGLGVSALFAVLGGLTQDHVLTSSTVILLGYSGRYPRRVLLFLMPLFLTAVVYDSQRYYADFIRGRIRVEEPYLFDKFFFGIATEEGVLTPNEWWQQNTHPLLDLYTGFFYIVFIPIFILFAAYFHFWKSRTGTLKYSSTQTHEISSRIMWSFFWVNLIGYSTYYWYPAAPPWYVADYGLGPADLSARASAAGCVRFDQILGTQIFDEWYGRSADVFGAIPSLHVAYPFQIVYYAFKLHSARTAAVIFYLSVSFAAVYLNHHYILDVIWGTAYALIVCLAIDWWKEKKSLAV